MYFVVGALVLLAAGPILAETSAPWHAEATMNLTEVVENCYEKNNITCDRLITYYTNLENGVVDNDPDFNCYFACMEIDSESMFPGEPFYLPNYHRWFYEYQWPLIDSGVTNCSSGENMYIENVCDREYDYITCLSDTNDTEVLWPKIPPFPSFCT